MTLAQDAAFHALKQEVAAGAVERCRRIAVRLRQRPFPQQLQLINDPERHKSLLCPRRAGKSYALAIYILLVMLERPHANIVFIARTRDKAREILWDTAETSLKKLNRDFEIGLDFSEVHTSIRSPNGSRARLRGCETLADVEQFRGEPFHLVVIDEAASFSPTVLENLINRGIEPTLADFMGTLVLSGTPGHIPYGPFYKATGDKAFEIVDGVAMSRPWKSHNLERWHGVEYSYSFHSWSREDNVIIPHLWQEAQRIKKLNGWSDQHPVWLREYMGRWVPDNTTLVYRFDPERNVWNRGDRSEGNPFGLPVGHVWKYVAGMDFGTKDPFALQVAAYSDTHPHLFHVYEHVEKGLLPPGFADCVRKVQAICDLEWMVGDFGPYGELLQQQMLVEYDLNIERAVKKDKRDHIELLNGDFIDGRCFLLEGSEVVKQMLFLSWDDTGLKEKSGQRNDAADALVYIWRRVFHHFSAEASAPGPEFGSRGFLAAAELVEMEDVAREEKNRLTLTEDRWYDADDEARWYDRRR